MNKYKYDGTKPFDISKFKCDDTNGFKDRSEVIEEFVNNLEEINEYQQRLFAEKKEGLIFVFQAMDAAGKDGAVRACLSCLSPQGVAEHSFKVPSSEEGRHDYLWRFWKALPEKGCISILNRSYYEDVLVQKVHDYYKNYEWADRIDQSKLIEQRYKQIVNFEEYLWENSYRVVKIFLNVSKDEQARRFISRIDTPKKNWKFSSGDVEEREYWDEYMDAYEVCINNTGKKNAPWYVIPADHKWYARLCISRIILNELKKIDPKWPVLAKEEADKLSQYRAKLALETTLNKEEETKNNVKPADTAISIAYKGSKVSSSQKKIRKKVAEYFKDRFEENNIKCEDTLIALEEVYLDKEELQAGEELKNANELETLYKALNKRMKEEFSGYGKEASKIYKRFKDDTKECLKAYSETVEVFYNEYENALIKYITDYEKEVYEDKLDKDKAYAKFVSKLDGAYKLSRKNAKKIFDKSIADLNHFDEKYQDVAKIFKSTNKDYNKTN